MKLWLAVVVAVAGLGWGSGVRGAEVVIYTSVDEPYFTPLFQRFEKETGISVRSVTDAESSKTAGLGEKLLAEKGSPRADVYWGNEVFHTVNLAGQGCFAPYMPGGEKGSAKEVPERFRDPQWLWTAIGLRARMVIIPAGGRKVTSLKELTQPGLKGKIAMANPAFGTTSGHMAALYLTMGKAAYSAWVEGLKANEIKLLGGNGAVAAQVAAGNFAAGLTDNDDVAATEAAGEKVEGVVPEETLLIPTTIALVAHAPHEGEGKKLIDFLTTPEVETELLRAKFLAYSTRQVAEVKSLQVDYAKCAAAMKEAVELTLKILQSR